MAYLGRYVYIIHLFESRTGHNYCVISRLLIIDIESKRVSQICSGLTPGGFGDSPENCTVQQPRGVTVLDGSVYVTSASSDGENPVTMIMEIPG